MSLKLSFFSNLSFILNLKLCQPKCARVGIAQRRTYIQWIWKKAENATRDQRTNAFSSHSKTSKEAQARSRKHNGAIKLERSQLADYRVFKRKT